MAAEPQRMRMSVEEYLAFDRASERKHEYWDGEVVAMAGAKAAHIRLTGKMFYLLEERLGSSDPCRAYITDMRVQVDKKRYIYPDVVVSCDVDDHREDNDILSSPHLVVEVLSPSTEAVDRGQKLSWYQSQPSVQEYVLINTRVQLVEVYRRSQVDKSWIYVTYGPGSKIVLDSLDISIPVDTLYNGLRIPIPAEAETGEE